MTNWNKYGSTLEIRHQYIKSFEEFLGTLAGNVDGEPLWEIDAEEDEINPISYSTENPENYLTSYIEIAKWLKKRRLNCESGYSFSYTNEENPDERSVGGINSNNEGVTFFELHGDGKITQQFFEI
jgi:hypothetical protein